MNINKITKIAVFVSLALLMFLIERALPPLVPIAAVKIGLANVVTLIALVILGTKEAYIILLLRCFLAALFGGFSTLMYSVPAGLASLTVEWLLYKFAFPKVSLMFLSFVSALVFNVSQVLIASIIAGTNLMILLPFSLIGSLIAGSFIGIVAFYVIKNLPKNIYLPKRL